MNRIVSWAQWGIGSLALGWAALVAAQPNAVPADEFDLLERNRIEQQRGQAIARFEREEVQCYQNFAVNDCLSRVRNTRRDSLADWRRQELSLNSAQAKRRAADQVTRTEDKSSAQATQAQAVRQDSAQDAQKERQRVFDEKAALRKSQATPVLPIRSD